MLIVGMGPAHNISLFHNVSIYWCYVMTVLMWYCVEWRVVVWVCYVMAWRAAVYCGMLPQCRGWYIKV